MIRRAALAGVVALLLIGTSSAAAATPARGAFAGLVDLGDGRRIHLECRGAGSPVVVLEAGLRSRSDFWKERLDGTTLGTTGLSRSDPVPMPRTAKDAVADLRALLRAARLPGPYVLAGHSTGGLIVRLFATVYPGQVAGLVEVDALSEFLQGPLSRAQIAAYDELNNGPLPGLEGDADLERILFRPSFGQMRRAAAARPLCRDLPLVVISRRLPLVLPPGLPEGLTTPVVERAWRAGQDQLAALLPGARRVVAARSSHYVMFSQPGVIIDAVRDVVRTVRSTQRRNP